MTEPMVNPNRKSGLRNGRLLVERGLTLRLKWQEERRDAFVARSDRKSFHRPEKLLRHGSRYMMVEETLVTKT